MVKRRAAKKAPKAKSKYVLKGNYTKKPVGVTKVGKRYKVVFRR